METKGQMILVTTERRSTGIFNLKEAAEISKAKIKESTWYQKTTFVRFAVNDIRVDKIVDIKIIVIICVVQ